MIITVEFIGGFLDGKVVHSPGEDPGDPFNATRTYFMTGKGEVGRKFRTVSAAALEALRTLGPDNVAKRGFRMNYCYEVVERQEETGTVAIKLQSVPVPVQK